MVCPSGLGTESLDKILTILSSVCVEGEGGGAWACV